MPKGFSDMDTGPHPVDRHVGRRVAERRISLGYNQSDLGKAIGVTFQQVQKYEKGSNRISASRLWTIAHFFGVEVNAFFDGLEPAEPGPAPSDPPAAYWPTTPTSVEISRRALKLSTSQQKLTLGLINELVDPARPAPLG